MADQPEPVPNDHPAVWDLVIADMAARDRLGASRYGVRLQPHNGRDSLLDLTEELYDAVAYLRQYREEMKWLGRQLLRLRALLATPPCPDSDALAEAASLLALVFEKIPALTAE